MSNTDLDKRMVLAYRGIFKGKLAKLRKRNKVRDVVEQHKDHFHHKQLTDSMDTEKTCRILRALLIARLFESKSVAEATFPTLFSTREFGTDGQEESVECEYRPRDGENADAPLFSDVLLSANTPLPDSAIPPSTLRVQHRIDQRSGRIRKPTRATTKPTEIILQMENGKKAMPKDLFHQGMDTSTPNIRSTLTRIYFRREKRLEADPRLRYHPNKPAPGLAPIYVYIHIRIKKCLACVLSFCGSLVAAAAVHLVSSYLQSPPSTSIRPFRPFLESQPLRLRAEFLCSSVLCVKSSFAEAEYSA
jgi:hypothetical protein